MKSAEFKKPKGLFALILFILLLPGATCQRQEKLTAVISGKVKVLPGDHNGLLVHDGKKRTYIIHVPESVSFEKEQPLVFVLHGGGGTGQNMVSLTKKGFNRIADREGFIVVYPDGINRRWNDGRITPGDSKSKGLPDDVGFISALIDHLDNELNVDLGRVYSTGISNGAFMSHRLAIELSGRIAAIAPVVGPISEEMSKKTPSRPVPVLLIIGTDDPLIPWEGGDIHIFRRKGFGRSLSARDTVSYWVTSNGCDITPKIVKEPDLDPFDGTTVTCEEYSPRGNGAEVVFYTIEKGGHTWPGGMPYLPRWIIGNTSRDINANEIIWNFFRKHSISR